MKREPLGNEREQDSWLRTMLRRSPATAPDACLDAETLAAWADGALSARQSAAVELHASNCSRCMGVLAAMERTAPAVSSTRSWAPARVFRWLVPLTAAATAIAIWVAVPDRPITPVQPAPAHDLAGPAPGTPAPRIPERGTSEPGTPEPGTPNVEPRTRYLEPGTRNQEPGTPTLEPRSQPAPSARLDKPVAQEELPMRDELRRERAVPEAFGAAAAPEAPPPAAVAAREAPPPAATPPAAPPAARSAEFATDTLTETVAPTAQRSTLSRTAASADSVSPTNPLIRWRIVRSSSIERSTDGGKTWTRTTSPARAIVAVRAVDAERAVARTSDNTEFYTTNGGRSWTRVQENSAAPF